MTIRALVLGLLAIAVVLAGAALGPLVPTGGGLLAILFLLCGADWWLAPSGGDWEARRLHAPALALAAENPIELRFRARLRRPVPVEARDEAPPEITCSRSFLTFQLQPGVEYATQYLVRPRVRGPHKFGRIVVRCPGPLGLWRRQTSIPAAEEVAVYPALAAIGRWEALVRRGAVQEMGVRSWRRFGEGTEFQGVREYVPGDDFRRINWRASARLARPMLSQFEPERSRPIWLVLDCGRLMAGGSGPLTKLDGALSAALLLAWVALFRGDRVGALAVAGAPVAAVPLRGGRSHYPRLLERLSALRPELVDPDWELVIAQLRKRQGPRALIVIFTDLADPKVAAELARATALLRPRHLPLVVTQRDPALEAARRRPPMDDLALYRRAAALGILEERELALQQLQRLGVLTVDSGPEGVSPALLNRYLELKGRGQL
ncbi:MAG: DUF58 domain-containing protein [Candidatus Dormibacteraeota bacterium]|nr:DUF58 domain-containing protein [Candidatus Dormibacteraeota bacterium]